MDGWVSAVSFKCKGNQSREIGGWLRDRHVLGVGHN